MFYDRVSFTTATTGTGTITVGSAESGFQTPAQAAAPDGDIVQYAIVDGTAWECGNGVIGASATTMTRVLSDSSTGSLLNLSGSARCFFTPIAETMNDIADRRIVGQTSAPSNPAAGSIKLFGTKKAGAVIPAWLDEVGRALAIQEALWACTVGAWLPGATTTISTIGSGVSTAGTVSHAALTTFNFKTKHKRVLVTSAATAGSLASQRAGGSMETTREDGWFLAFRGGVSILVSGQRFFAGLADVNTAPTNVDPFTATTPGKLGFGFNSDTGNLHIIHNITGSVPTTINLGASFAVNANDVFELFMACQPSGNVGWLVNKLDSTGGVAASDTGTISTNLPAITTFLARQVWTTNNATASACALDYNRFYLAALN